MGLNSKLIIDAEYEIIYFAHKIMEKLIKFKDTDSEIETQEVYFILNKNRYARDEKICIIKLLDKLNLMKKVNKQKFKIIIGIKELSKRMPVDFEEYNKCSKCGKNEIHSKGLCQKCFNAEYWTNVTKLKKESLNK